MTAAPAGLIIAAPASGSGKTVATLGLLRALKRRGVAVAGAKAGPDYIDPAFHAAASGRPCFNLDPWAMRAQTIAAVIAETGRQAELVVCEGVMGLFDGAADGKGSTADLAALTAWPVVLVADVRGQGASAAALVQGFAKHRADVRVAAAVFNRAASAAHEKAIAAAMAATCPEIPVLGFVPRDPNLALPERHLGLVPARELAALDRFLDHAADVVETRLDLAALRSLARPARVADETNMPPMPLPPLGQRMAVARDDAFAFCYEAVMTGWRGAGAELSLFSPLAGEMPDSSSDAVYLPGGYPELHAGRLANSPALAELRRAAARGAAIYGECGGYMVLGRGLEDASGARHAMAGLLALETSFARRKLHLGYREATLTGDSPLGDRGARYRGHEFHYATVASEGPGEPLFRCRDASGAEAGAAGLKAGRVMGSFIHLVDRA
jgi:cobyrinic acid a,c-diamide synthase